MLSVGQLLQAERLKKNLTLGDIEKAIKIRPKFLAAVEEEKWQIFSSKIYIAGVIKNYALYLGLDYKKMLAFFRRQYEKTEEVSFKRRVALKYLTPETKKAATIAVVILLLAFFGYFLYQLKQFLSPPTVTIIAPTQTVFKREERIKITGRTDKEAVVTVFGERVYQNKDGIFEYDFLLRPGVNEITIEVTGANGKKTLIKRNYIKQ